MLEYSDSIQSLPWDKDFASECTLLEEATKENSFIKNLDSKFFLDKGAWGTAGGLVLSVAAAGVLPQFTTEAAANASAIVAGGATVAAKIAQAFMEHSQQKKEIQKKDLYFYYQAGKLLQ